jgi:hypothetical protein
VPEDTHTSEAEGFELLFAEFFAKRPNHDREQTRLLARWLLAVLEYQVAYHGDQFANVIRAAQMMVPILAQMLPAFGDEHMPLQEALIEVILNSSRLCRTTPPANLFGPAFLSPRFLVD